MHRPRACFSVGSLLFAVAVVAANFSVFGRFFETHQYTYAGGVGFRVLPAGVGVIPLVNVALAGVWFFAVKRLRSRRHRHAADTPTSPSGFAFFSLHFLLLVCLIGLYMPDEVRILQMVLDPAIQYAAAAWGTVFGEPGETVPWLILDSLVLGVIVSGPLLLLSWIGQVLATRCDATLPPCRFRVTACLVSSGFAGAGLAICLAPQPFEEEREVAFDVQIIDERSGQPLAPAFVRITEPFAYESSAAPPSIFTDENGRARLVCLFVVRGDRNAFVSFGSFSPWGRWLNVSAAGHVTRRIPLTDVLGHFADPVRPRPCRIALARGDASADSFRDLAGLYTDGRSGFGGSWLAIEPDGRFAWNNRGCTYNSEEYGYLRRDDREIVLVSIPHPGKETDPAFAPKYRATEWGSCRYLTPANRDGFREFCREILKSKYRSTAAYIEGSYLRESDRDRPRVGRPRLPMGVWTSFLIDELRYQNEEGSLRLALNTLFPRLRGEGRSPADDGDD